MNYSSAAARVVTIPAQIADAALPYRPDIDGLRAVAVCAVLAYHAFPTLLTGGFIGVDIFFVISGYLISQIIITGLQSGNFSLAEFYRRRVRRILPALLLVLAACGIFGWFALLPTELLWLGRSMSWCAPFLANIYFARTGAGYFEKVEDLNPLLHLWSLGVEEQFYIVWPVLLLLVAKRGMIPGLLIAVLTLSLAISVWGAWHDPRRYFYFPVSRGWEFTLGAILVVFQAHGPRANIADNASRRFWSAAQACSLAGLVLIAASAAFLTARLAIPGIWSAIPTMGAALLIAAGPRMSVNRWLSHWSIRSIGRVSYPLYLWHWPLFSFARIFLGHPPSRAWASGAIVIAFGAACATYRWVERPIRHGRLGRWTVVGLLAALACLAALGAAVGAHWLPGRLTGPPFAAWDAAATDWDSPATASTDRQSGIMTVIMTSHLVRKTLFIGDSHLEHYWSRAEQVIDEHPDVARSAVFLSYRGCPPMPGIEVTWRGRHCKVFFEYAMRRAFEPDVDTVVFGAFWEKLFLGEFAVQPVHGVQDLWPAPLQLDSPVTQQAFEQFRQAVANLVARRRRVFIVLSNPTSPLFEPLFPPDLRLSLHPPQHLPEGPRIEAAPFESFVAPISERLRSIAAQTGATVVDPRPTLCDGMLCPSTGPDGLPLYLDSNHLRATYARQRASFVDQMLLDPSTQ